MEIYYFNYLYLNLFINVSARFHVDYISHDVRLARGYISRSRLPVISIFSDLFVCSFNIPPEIVDSRKVSRHQISLSSAWVTRCRWWGERQLWANITHWGHPVIYTRLSWRAVNPKAGNLIEHMRFLHQREHM